MICTVVASILFIAVFVASGVVACLLAPAIAILLESIFVILAGLIEAFFNNRY